MPTSVSVVSYLDPEVPQVQSSKMHRFGLTLVRTFECRNLPIHIAAGSRGLLATSRPSSLEAKERYSTQASNLKKILPELWIMKMKTAFMYHDLDGDGYLTEKDMAIWTQELAIMFPGEEKEVMEERQRRIWQKIIACGKTEKSGHGVTENMFIESMFLMLTGQNSEASARERLQGIFDLMDLNKDGKLSKTEHRRWFEAMKCVDPNGAIVAFSAMDEDHDGVITREEYVKAGMEFFFNLADETKPSKHFFGPLVKTPW